MHPNVSGTGRDVSFGARLLWDPSSRHKFGLFSHSHFLPKISSEKFLWMIASYYSRDQGCIDPATWLDTSIEGDSTDEPSNVAF
jgi:hypothetical protein